MVSGIAEFRFTGFGENPTDQFACGLASRFPACLNSGNGFQA